MRTTKRPVISIFLFFLLVVISVQAKAQTATSSPYSIYGLGDLESRALSQYLSMGDVKYAINNPSVINVANPATYSQLNRPTFDVGMRTAFLQLSSNGTTQNNSNTYIRSITLGFPIVNSSEKKRKWGFSFGLIPFTQIGYSIKDNVTDSITGDVEFDYEGEGGIDQVYLGTGYELWHDSNGINILSVGANISYMFGPVTRTRRTVFTDDANAFNTRITNTINLSDVYYDFGLYYKRVLTDSARLKEGKLEELSFGVVYTPALDITARNTTFAASYTGDAQFESIQDTIVDSQEKGSAKLPSNIGIGIALNINHQLTLALDVSQQDWSNYAFFGVKQGLADRQQVSFGVQYIPDYKAQRKVLKTMNYRGGIRYVNTRLNVNGEDLREYGINFGLGVPLISSSSSTMFNIGVEYGQRGKEGVGLIKEQFTNLSFGFSFTPHKFDRWFYKRKID